MVWTTPVTAVANAALTASQWNASVRDNLLETAVAKATTAGYHFASAGPNSIAERAILATAVDTSETTASTSFVDLATAGPSVTMTTGTRALVWMNAQMSNSGTATAVSSYGVSGASTVAPGDSFGIVLDSAAASSPVRGSVTDLRALTSGSNTFFMQYRVTAGTGTFLRRRIQVMGL